MMDSHASNQEDAEEDSLVTWPLDTIERNKETAGLQERKREKRVKAAAREPSV